MAVHFLPNGVGVAPESNRPHPARQDQSLGPAFLPADATVSKRPSSSTRLLRAIRLLDNSVDHGKRDAWELFSNFPPRKLVFVVREPGLGVRDWTGRVRQSSFELMEPPQKIPHARLASRPWFSVGPFNSARTKSIMCAPSGSVDR